MSNALPEPIEELMSLAWTEAKQARAEAVEPVHLFIAVCKQNLPAIARALDQVGIDPVKLRRRVRGFARAIGAKQNAETGRVSGRVASLLEGAKLVTDVMINLLTKPDNDLKAVFEGEFLPTEKLRELLKGESGKPDAAKDEKRASAGGGALEKFGKDYTQLARDGKLEPVIGRREELKQVIRVLLRKQKNNPVLVGEAGVGKTSIVEGLAAYAASDQAPPRYSSQPLPRVIFLGSNPALYSS